MRQIRLSAVLMLNGLASGSVAMLLGSLVDDIPRAIELAPASLVPQIVFSGWIMPVRLMPQYLQRVFRMGLFDQGESVKASEQYLACWAVQVTD